MKLLDQLATAGVRKTWSAPIRHAVVRLADALRRAETGTSIASSYQATPQSAADDDLALANAIVMTEAEHW